MRVRTGVAVAAATVLLAVAGCADDGEQPDQTGADTTAESPQPEPEQPGEGEQPEMPEMPEPELDDVPEVVAEVNGTEIAGDEFARVYEGQFQQAAMQAQMAGQPVDQDALKQQTAEGMVDTELLLQEAEARSLAPTQEEVDAAAEEVAAGSGLGSADELFTALEEQGLDREEAMAELEQQTALEQLFTDEAGEFSASEEELREVYDEAIAQQPPAAEGQEAPEPPAFEEVRPQLEEQLRNQHQGEAAQGLVADLRESADIEVYI